MRDPEERDPVTEVCGERITVTYHEISIDDRDVIVLCGGCDHLDEMSVRETEVTRDSR